MMLSKKIKLVTHDGSFHADDIFSAATLSIYLEKQGKRFEIIRTRDGKILASADYVFDVGGVYDADKNRFDHHQPGGAGNRAFGDVKIEYAAFGLVWKKFGAELCGGEKAANLIDKKLVAPIDAGDNGFDLVDNLYEVSPYFIHHAFSAMRPTWSEENLENMTDNVSFLKCVGMAKEILAREIIQARDGVLAESLVISIYENTRDKRIIVLDKHYPFEYTLNNFPEPLFVVCKRESSQGETWGVKALREDPKTFKNRKNFPASWAGLRDEELQKITGVKDAMFCHRGLFLAVAKSKEGAIKLAQIAIES